MNTLIPLIIFAFVSSITPGPNNIMLTTSGVLYGFKRTIPHMLGITSGFAVMLFLCAAGIGSLLLAVPAMHTLLKIVGSSYLMYLAWQLRNMSFNQQELPNAHPMSFLGAAAFQFANPKAWIMAITGASAFLPAIHPIWLATTVFSFIFCAVNLPCISLWAATGALLRHYLTQPHWRKLFSSIMSLLTVYSAVSIWL